MASPPTRSPKREADPRLAGSEPGLSVEAPAKINLYLHVLGRRADGYHLLDSLIAFATVRDRVTLRPAPAFSFASDGEFAAALPPGDDNLVSRAARALAEARGMDPKCAVTLTKDLPVAAGIGGGSADAAATLLGLRALWDLDIDDDELSRIGLTLGADVPACLRGTTLYAGGVGERIDPGPALPPLGLVLVNPRVPVSTAEVFRRFAGPFSEPRRLAEPAAENFVGQLAARRNDLTEAATGLAPVIATVLETIEREAGCLLARLSGSGPTCFGLFGDEAAARDAGAAIAARRADWWVAASGFRDQPITPEPL